MNNDNVDNRTTRSGSTHRLTVLVGLLLLGALSACGSGGSGGGTQAALSPDDEAIRFEAFRDEALARMFDHIELTCTAVLCRDHTHDWDWPAGPNGVVTSGCHFACVPSEIDESGEVRTFQASITFARNEEGCFTREVFGTRFVREIFSLCTPNF